MWEKEPGTRIDAGWEGAEHCILGPDVIPLEDGGYRTYYEGKTEAENGAARSAVVSALSDDGLAWEKEPGIRLGGEDHSYGAVRRHHLSGRLDSRAVEPVPVYAGGKAKYLARPFAEEDEELKLNVVVKIPPELQRKYGAASD